MKHYIFYYKAEPFTQEAFENDESAIAAAKAKPGLISVLACDGSLEIFKAEKLEPEPTATAVEKAEENAKP